MLYAYSKYLRDFNKTDFLRYLLILWDNFIIHMSYLALSVKNETFSIYYTKNYLSRSAPLSLSLLSLFQKPFPLPYPFLFSTCSMYVVKLVCWISLPITTRYYCLFKICVSANNFVSISALAPVLTGFGFIFSFLLFPENFISQFLRLSFQFSCNELQRDVCLALEYKFSSNF